jgi:hypothetical protein
LAEKQQPSIAIKKAARQNKPLLDRFLQQRGF